MIGGPALTDYSTGDRYDFTDSEEVDPMNAERMTRPLADGSSPGIELMLPRRCHHSEELPD